MAANATFIHAGLYHSAFVAALGAIPGRVPAASDQLRILVGELLDVVVIDGSLVWCGDVAPLAYPRRDDCMLRFVRREVAVELAEALAKCTV